MGAFAEREVLGLTSTSYSKTLLTLECGSEGDWDLRVLRTNLTDCFYFAKQTQRQGEDL